MSNIILTDKPAALPPLTKTQAEAIAAMDGVLRRYRLVEWHRCRTCYSAGRDDGARSRVNGRSVFIECRCGSREYVAPQGTSDLGGNRANSALLLGNQGEIIIRDGNQGVKKLKALKLEPEDAAIVRLYARVIEDLKLNQKLVHRDCWSGRVTDDAAMEVLVDDSKIALKCGCSVFHYDGSSATH